MNFKIKASIAFSIFYCLISFHSQAQNNPQNPFMATEVLPPAPNAGQLGKVAELQPGLFTGAARYQLNLYTLQTRDIKLPIDVSYLSNGVKVDEIASRIGVNWVLNIGGMINRTIYDVPDERGTHTYPPNGFDSRTTALYNYLKSAADNDYTGPDTQPDIFNFNFNGISGKFILDSLKRPVLLEKTGLKIEPDFSGTSWNFKITDQSGLRYYFGGSAATENTKTYTGNGANCGKSYGSPTPTAWYLNKIESLQGDIILFKYTALNSTYNTGVTESITRTPNTGAGGSCPGETVGCPVISNDIVCTSTLVTDGVALNEIDFDQGKITIENISRSDIQGDVLISNINVYNNLSTAILKRFSFEYTFSNSGTQYISNSFIGASEKTRPFLTKIFEKDSAGAIGEHYEFTYEDINGLPPRLSFAQDHIGYFNGQNNAIFVPASSEPALKALFPTIMGNRDPDSLFAKKGLLVKIKYPTGGSDSLIYEPHKTWGTIIVPPTTKHVISTATGTGTRTGVTKSTTSPTLLSTVTASLSLRCDGLGGSGTYDTIHQFAEVSIIDATTSTSLIYLKALPFETKTASLTLTTGHSYTVKVTAYGSVIGGRADLSYADGNSTSQSVLQQLGGMRVAKIITFDPASSISMTKRFFYAPLSDLTASSSNTMFSSATLSYYKDFKNITSCESFCGYKQGSSSSLYNLYVYSGSNVVYGSVIEGLGNNFENGGIEHIFNVRGDVPAHVAIGNDIKGAPLTNIGWDNGLEIKTNYFKRNGINISFTKKVNRHYKDDLRASEIHKGYVISREYNVEHNPVLSSDFDQFDVLEYQLKSNWVYNDSTTTTDYDGLQNLIYTKVDVNFYDNPSHFNLTRSQSLKSDAKLLTTLITYPQDYNSTKVFINNLISNHVINVPLETVKYQQDANGSNTIILSGVLKTYKPEGNGLIDSLYGLKVLTPIPLSSFKFSNAVLGVLPTSGPGSEFNKSSNYEPRINSIGYDNFGNLLEQHLQNGPFVSYKWGYNSNYPIAKLMNGHVNEFYYESYEESTATGVLSGTGHTGSKFSTTGIVSWTKPNSRSYVITYWYRSNGLWKFQDEQVYAGPSFTMSGGDAYDDVRIYPLDAQMTTYTYDPLIGVTSTTDEKGQTAYFEYDSFLRLRNVKDQNKNILKNYIYNFTTLQ